MKIYMNLLDITGNSVIETESKPVAMIEYLPVTDDKDVVTTKIYMRVFSKL
jgi:hypothetical protein